MGKKKKEPEHVCNNCRLFSPKERQCSVIILLEGEKYKIPVDPGDKCFFEADPESRKLGGFQPLDFVDEIQEVKMWVENDKGQKAKEGTVKIEYPKGFFGKEKGD